MGIFDSIKRSWTIFLLKVTGRVDEANKLAMKDKHAITAAYAAEGEKLARAYLQTEQAVGTLIHEQEKQRATLERRRAELTRKKQIAEGAKRTAFARAKELGSADAAKADAAYQEHMEVRRAKLAEIKQIEEHIATLESDIESFGVNIDKAKKSLVKLERERSKLKGEAAEMTSRLISAESRKRVQGILSGIGVDRDDTFRSDIRDMVGQAEAEARVREELSGADAEDQDEAYLSAAASYEADADLEDELSAMFAKDEAAESGGKAADKPVAERPLDA